MSKPDIPIIINEDETTTQITHISQHHMIRFIDEYTSAIMQFQVISYQCSQNIVVSMWDIQQGYITSHPSQRLGRFQPYSPAENTHSEHLSLANPEQSHNKSKTHAVCLQLVGV